MIMDRMKRLRMKTVEPALKVVFKPEGEKVERARAYGRRFGKKLKEEEEPSKVDSLLSAIKKLKEHIKDEKEEKKEKKKSTQQFRRPWPVAFPEAVLAFDVK